jgi:hypothetical protein
MATSENHTNRGLASRLVAAADGIVNRAAVSLERDLRDAADVVRESNRPMALMPRLLSDVAKIANTTTDADTQLRLRRLIGEAR